MTDNIFHKIADGILARGGRIKHAYFYTSGFFAVVWIITALIFGVAQVGLEIFQLFFMLIAVLLVSFVFAIWPLMYVVGFYFSSIGLVCQTFSIDVFVFILYIFIAFTPLYFIISLYFSKDVPFRTKYNSEYLRLLVVIYPILSILSFFSLSFLVFFFGASNKDFFAIIIFILLTAIFWPLQIGGCLLFFEEATIGMNGGLFSGALLLITFVLTFVVYELQKRTTVTRDAGPIGGFKKRSTRKFDKSRRSVPTRDVEENTRNYNFSQAWQLQAGLSFSDALRLLGLNTVPEVRKWIDNHPEWKNKVRFDEEKQRIEFLKHQK